MATKMLDQEAAELLTAIGIAVERWVLEHSSSTLEHPSATDDEVIRRPHVEDSLEAFIEHGVRDLKGLVSESRMQKRGHPTLRTG